MFYIVSDELMHYGVKRKSGRYPWGSGERPFQRTDIKGQYKLKSKESPNKWRAKKFALSLAVNVPAAIASLAIPGFSAVWNTYVISSKVKAASRMMSSTDYTKKEGNFGSIKDLNKKETETTITEDLKNVNPRLSSHSKGKYQNCMNCVQAMEMRRRGYDVQARSSDSGSMTEYYAHFKNIEFFDIIGDEKKPWESRNSYVNRFYNYALNEMEYMGDGARGCITLFYDKKLNMRAGHTMYWEVSNGQAKVYDPQSGGNEKFMENAFLLSDPTSWKIARLDKCQLDDSITEAVVNRKGKK